MSTGDLKMGLEVFKGFSGKLAQAVIGFIGTIIFARVLGPTSFGAFYFLQSLVFISDRPIKGTGSALSKRLSEAEAPREEIVGTGMLTAGIGSLFALPTLIWNEQLTTFTGVRNAGVVFLVIFASVSFFFIIQRLLEGIGLVGAKVWNDTVRSALTLAAQLAFVLTGFGAAGMGYGLATGTIISAGIGLYFVDIRPHPPSRQTIRSVWTYARYSIPDSLIGKVYGRIDTLILGILTTTAFVGYYEVSLKLSIPATFLSGTVASALFPKVSHRHSGGRGLSHDTQNAISYSSILSIPILFGALAVPTKLVVTAYGPAYRAAAPFLVALVFVQVLSSQVAVYRSALQGMDLPDISLRVNATSLTINVVVALAGLYLIGPIGVVVGSVVAELWLYLLISHTVTKRIKLSRFSRPLMDQVLAGVGMYAALGVASMVLRIASVFDLAFFVSFGAAVYFILLYAISGGFRITVNSVLADIAAEYGRR